MDPENHVSVEFSQEEVTRKERRRGLHLRPSVVRHSEERHTEDDFMGNYNDQTLDLNNSMENATGPANSIADDLQNSTTGGLDEIPPPLPSRRSSMDDIPPPLPPRRRPSSPPTRVSYLTNNSYYKY